MSAKEILQVEYKRFVNNNYILLYCDKEGILKNYQTRMILENRVQGLLPVSIRYMNRREILYYDITSKQPLGRVFENTEMSCNQVRGLLLSLAQIYENIQNYLLNAKHLVLEPEYVYVDVETMEVNILFCPEYEKEAKSAIQDLAEFFLNRVNHKDEKAVVLVYQFYKNTREENFSLEKLLTTLLQESTEEDHFADEINTYEKDNYIPILQPSQESEIDKGKQEIKNQVKRQKQNKTKDRKIKNCISGEEKNNYEKIKNRKTRDVVSNDLKGKEDITKNSDGGRLKKYKEAIMIPIAIIMLLITTLLYSLKVVNYQQGIIAIGISLMIAAIGVIITIQKYVNRTEAEEVHIDLEEEEFKEEKPKIEIYDFLTDFTKPSQVAEEEITYGSTVFIAKEDTPAIPKLVRNENGKREEYLLEKFPFVIGKVKGQTDLIIESQEISRIHARFIEKNGIIFLEDMNSTNGTFKNGIQLENNEIVIVSKEDEISFAGHIFYFLI